MMMMMIIQCNYTARTDSNGVVTERMMQWKNRIKQDIVLYMNINSLKSSEAFFTTNSYFPKGVIVRLLQVWWSKLETWNHGSLLL